MEERRWEQKKEQEGMRERIRRFDKEFLSYGDDMQKIAVGILETIVVILMMLPYQIYGEELSLLFVLAIFMPYPSMIYMMSYLSFSERKKTNTIYGKIKYAPVDVRQLRR